MPKPVTLLDPRSTWHDLGRSPDMSRHVKGLLRTTRYMQDGGFGVAGGPALTEFEGEWVIDPETGLPIRRRDLLAKRKAREVAGPLTNSAQQGSRGVFSRIGSGITGAVSGAADRVGLDTVASKALDLYNTDVPVYSNVARDIVQPVIKKGFDVADPVLPLVPGVGNLVNAVSNVTGDSAGDVAASFVPVSAGDVALELAPFAGKGLKAGGKALGKIDDLLRATPEELATLTRGPGDTFFPRVQVAGGAADDLAEWEYTLKRLQQAAEKGPEALKAEQARLLEINHARTAEQQANAAEAARARFSNTGKQNLASTADEMAQAAENARQTASAPAPGTDAAVRAAEASGDEVALGDALFDRIARRMEGVGTENFGAGVPGTVETANSFLANLASIPNALKRINTMGDIASAGGRQTQPLIFIDPKIWGRNVSRGVRAYFEDPAARTVMEEIEKLRRFADDDVFEVGDKAIVVDSMRKVLGIGEDFAAPGFEKVSNRTVDKFVDNLPLFQRSQKAQEAIIVGAATDLRNQMIDSAIRAGIANEDWYRHYGDIARVWTGYGNVPEALKGLSNNFYSLRNVAARFQTLTQPITKPGAVFASPQNMLRNRAIFSASPRGVATKNLFRAAVGEHANLLLLAAAGQNTGLFDVGWNPLASGYGSLQFADENGTTYNMDLLGGYGGMIRAMARTASWANDVQAGREPQYDPAIEWLKFSRYKLSGVPSSILDTIIANSPGLSGVEGLQSPFAFDLTDPEAWKNGEFIGKVLPFFAGEGAQGLLNGTFEQSPEGLMKAGLFTMTAFSGAPVGAYGPSATDKSNIGVKDALESGATYVNAAGETVPYPTTYTAADGTQKPVTSLTELRYADPLAADDFDAKNPDLKNDRSEDSNRTTQRIRELQQTHFDEQTQRDQALEAGDIEPSEWREASGDKAAQLAAAIRERAQDYRGEPETRGRLQAVLDRYSTAIEQATTPLGTDWTQVDREVASWSDQERSLLESNRLAGETPKRKEYLRDLNALEPYWEIKDREWAKAQDQNPRFQDAPSADAWRKQEVKRLTSEGRPPAVAEMIADALLEAYTLNTDIESYLYLLRNRDAISLLTKWGFSVAEELQALTPEYVNQFRPVTP